jgi:pimeloyl-ACP methyl ester carboxylesterase
VKNPYAIRDASVASADGVPIHFRAGGTGATAIVFVHGWLGDAAWWEPTLRHFATRYRVAALDLAGHGRSGAGRSEWSVERFAADVVAVADALELTRVVLIGHSMSGAITVEAARRLGPRAVLVVPVDTLNDLEWTLPPEVWAEFFAGLRADFPTNVGGFFRSLLFRPDSPPTVVARVVAQARAAEPERSVRMLEASKDFDLLAAVQALPTPIHALNTDLNPTELDTNRKYAPRFALTLLPGLAHWPMLEDPAAFQAGLERVLAAERVR